VKVRITMFKAHPTTNHIARTPDAILLGPPEEPGDTLVPYDTMCDLGEDCVARPRLRAHQEYEGALVHCDELK
jgi:hypothetical protein